jgi:hypothetical protein
MKETRAVGKPMNGIRHYDVEKPQQVVLMAGVLKTHILKHNLFTNIQGKNYVHVDGWSFAGGLIGTMPRIVRVEKMADGAWFAEAEIVNVKTQEIVSRGYALCSNKENKKKSFDEYAVLSMAQTRAIGKAYRNVLSWVMKLAGYEGTPAEEMKTAKPETEASGSEFDKAMAFIENAKTERTLLNALEKVQESDKFTVEEKKKLESKISGRIDAINETKK